MSTRMATRSSTRQTRSSTRQKNKTTPPENDENNTRTRLVRKACAASIRKLEKQTRTKIVNKNANAKKRKRRAKKTKAEKRYDIELRAQSRFMSSAIEQTICDEDEFLHASDFPKDMSFMEVQYQYRDPNSDTIPYSSKRRSPPQEVSSVLLPIIPCGGYKESIETPNRTSEGDRLMDLNYQIDNKVITPLVRAMDDDHNDFNTPEYESENGSCDGLDQDIQQTFNENDSAFIERRAELCNDTDWNNRSGEPGDWDQNYYGNDDRSVWESAGTYEDEEMFDMIGTGRRCVFFDHEKLCREFYQLESQNEYDEDAYDASSDYRLGKFLDPSPSGDHHMIFPITEKLAADELFKIIKASDIGSFFDHVSQTFSYPRADLNDMCDHSCGCHGEFNSLMLEFNPVQLAAALSTPEFLSYMLNEERVKHQLSIREVDQQLSILKCKHFMDVVRDWCRDRKKGYISALDVAAELGLVDNLHVIINSDAGRTALLRRKENEAAIRKNDSAISYEFFRHYLAEGIMTRLVENGMFFSMSPDDQELIIIHSKEEEIDYAVEVAASKGDVRFLAFIKAYETSLTQTRKQKVNIPGGRNTNSSRHEIPPPAAHLMAQYGHYEMFDRITDEEKRCTDVYLFTALSSMFEFTDEQILEQLPLYRDVVREDAFVFVSQIIVRNRMNLLNPVLSMVLNNPTYFAPPHENHPIYESYGLPSYVPLPMETSLSRRDTLEMFHKIVQIYLMSRKSAINKPMISEDAYRCLQSIQDKAFRITDHLRLAIFFMLMPFVNASSDRFHNIISMHLDKTSSDHVGEYLMEEVYKKRKTHGGQWSVIMQWNKAMITARKIVTEWGGTVETIGVDPTLATDTEKSRRAGNAVPTRSILKKREEKKQIWKDEEKQMKEALKGLAIAFKKLEMVE